MSFSNLFSCFLNKVKLPLVNHLQRSRHIFRAGLYWVATSLKRSELKMTMSWLWANHQLTKTKFFLIFLVQKYRVLLCFRKLCCETCNKLTDNELENCWSYFRDYYLASYRILWLVVISKLCVTLKKLQIPILSKPRIREEWIILKVDMRKLWQKKVGPCEVWRLILDFFYSFFGQWRRYRFETYSLFPLLQLGRKLPDRYKNSMYGWCALLGTIGGWVP